MDFEQLILQRQSCRKYDADKKVSAQDLEKILTAGALSPSAKNGQPWKFYVPQSEKAINGVRNACMAQGGNSFLCDVSTFVVVTMPYSIPKVKPEGIINIDWHPFDCGMCIMQMALQAKLLDIDSCILGWFNEKELSTAIGSPNEQVALVLALGYAEKGVETRVKNRRPLSETVKYV